MEFKDILVKKLDRLHAKEPAESLCCL